MRHGRLASALALVTFAGMATAQAPTSDFAVDREPETVAAGPALPSAAPPSPIAAAVLALPIRPADAAPPAPLPGTATQIPPAAGTTGSPTPPPVSVVPPGGVVLPPGGTMLFDGAVPVDPYRYWVSFEALAWRIKKDQVPPLVTTGPATFPVGFLGNPGTTVLFQGDLDQGTLTGGRLRFGMWLDDCRTWGLEASVFCLPEQKNNTTFGSNQFPVLARPFTDVNPGGPNSEFLAFPGLATGNISIENSTQFCGATIAARCPFWTGCCTRVDALAGLQCLDLREELTIVETPRGTPDNPFPGGANTQFIATDTFKTRNRFYGAFVGVEGSYNYGSWTVGLLANVGAGINRQTVEIAGSQVAIPAIGSPTTAAGGLLAVPGANIGRYTKNQFSVVPQVGLNLGYQLTDCIQLFGGYSCLYWTKVARPGGQIDTVLDVNRIPNFGGGPVGTSNRPAVPFDTQSFWAQGVSLGVRLSW